MKTLLKGGLVYTLDGFKRFDVAIEGDSIFEIAENIDVDLFDRVIHCDNSFVIPGLVDVHVHLREPGGSYKETIATGTKAAAHGGYTCVCAMPNLKPVPSNMADLQKELDIIERDAVIKVIPYGTITETRNGMGKLSDMEEMVSYVAGFSDDGDGVMEADLMRAAMQQATTLGSLIAAHCQDMKYHTQDPRSEFEQIERDLALAKETKAKYHVCHISTKESVEYIRRAKADGVNVTCETGPHYLVFSNENLPDEGRFKMNPPIRTAEDKAALIEGILDGTIDMIATDHAPHSAEEKSRGFKGSLFGVVGLETAISVLYTYFVDKGLITMEKLVELMSIAPRQRFDFAPGNLEVGAVADIAVFDPKTEWTVDSDSFFSMGKSTPFDGMTLKGQVALTVYNGEIVYER